MLPSPCGTADGADRFVCLYVADAHHRAVSGCEYGLAEAVPGFGLRGIAVVGPPVDELQEVDGVLLIGVFVVVAEELAACRPR